MRNGEIKIYENPNGIEVVIPKSYNWSIDEDNKTIRIKTDKMAFTIDVNGNISIEHTEDNTIIRVSKVRMINYNINEKSSMIVYDYKKNIEKKPFVKRDVEILTKLIKRNGNTTKHSIDEFVDYIVSKYSEYLKYVDIEEQELRDDLYTGLIYFGLTSDFFKVKEIRRLLKKLNDYEEKITEYMSKRHFKFKNSPYTDDCASCWSLIYNEYDDFPTLELPPEEFFKSNPKMFIKCYELYGKLKGIWFVKDLIATVINDNYLSIPYYDSELAKVKVVSKSKLNREINAITNRKNVLDF